MISRKVISINLLVMICIGCLLHAQTAYCVAAQDAAKDQTKRISKSTDGMPPTYVDTARLKHKIALWFSNRKIDGVANNVRPRLSVDKVLTSEISSELSYGWMKISYPAGRQKGNQNYNSDPDSKNSLTDFVVVDYDTLSTVESLKRYAGSIPTSVDKNYLMYVHGYDHTFSDSAERLAQISLDILEKSTPVMFSWPSDAYRNNNVILKILGLVDSYEQTKKTAVETRPFLSLSLKIINKDFLGNTDLLAHSMGTDVVINSIANIDEEIKIRSWRSSIKTNRFSFVRSIILAAPDIGRSFFDKGLAERIRQANHRLTIYCTNDRALLLSTVINRHDSRIGYCDDYTKFMTNANFVIVSGIGGLNNHSYYLTEPLVIDDIKEVFLNGLVVSKRSPVRSDKIRYLQIH